MVQRSGKCIQHGEKDERNQKLTALRKQPHSEERTLGLLQMKAEDDSGFCNEESKPSVPLFDFY